MAKIKIIFLSAFFLFFSKSILSYEITDLIKILVEKNEINSETFNLTKDKLTVKEVAEICKNYNSKIILKSLILIFLRHTIPLYI